MKCSAKAIANSFPQIHPSGLNLSKLQKLVYFAHGLHLAIFDRPLVTDEIVQAGKLGPIFPSLYRGLIDSNKFLEKTLTTNIGKMKIFYIIIMNLLQKMIS